MTSTDENAFTHIKNENCLERWNILNIFFMIFPGNFPSSSASGSQLDEKIVLGQTVKKDDLFYDADIDKQNQEWMDRKRRKNSSTSL